MNFKKNYINFVLYCVLQSEFYGVKDDLRIRKVLEKIISVSDEAKATYLTGKTAGLEILFKYLLYISDKIDKSQITIFNLKDNFDYDLQNLKRICGALKSYRGAVVKHNEPENPSAATEEENLQPLEENILHPLEEEISGFEEPGEELISEEKRTAIEEDTGLAVETEELISETAQPSGSPEFTLIENAETGSTDEEIFGLEEITRSVEMGGETEREGTEDSEEEFADQPEEKLISEAKPETEPEDVFEPVEYEDEILSEEVIKKINGIKEREHEKEELEIEIKKQPAESEVSTGIHEEIKGGTITSDVYYRFETKFFEEAKILEKLFSYTQKECKGERLEKLSERTLQSFTEIIEISSELSNLARQLQLDLISDIFLTINLLFTKSIKTPSLVFPERVELLKASLSLVTSLIKGEDYLDYDEMVNKIEDLKETLTKPQEALKRTSLPGEKHIKETITEIQVKDSENMNAPDESRAEAAAEPPDAEIQKADSAELSEKAESEDVKTEPVMPDDSGDTSYFKMKYLVKEFEKNFLSLNEIEGEYSRFEILDNIDNLNSLLRMLAKVSASVKNDDVLKLSEVSYVFLKYLKDYKMDLLDSEIQQIIKYIIFTYKMLLTGRKPEDFEILVQYLNNPVKIFTDT